MSARLRSAIVVSVAAVLSGCMIAKQPAPVVQRSPEPVGKPAPSAEAASAARPDTYTVKRGDTLYGIALDHRVDYRDLARWNNIANPAAIEVGQVLRMRDPAAIAAAPAVAAPSTPAPGEAIATPYQAAPPVQGKPMGSEAVPLPPVAETREPTSAQAPSSGIITTPQAVKVPYSQAALAKLQESASASASASPATSSPAASAPPAASPAGSSPDAAAPNASAPAAAKEREKAPATEEEPDAVAFGWPTKGRIIAGFNENGGPKGVQIAGNLGQAIVASAPGRVVYTGSGLRGYGNLVIIKHNNTYLSAYAHNRTVLVKQGDTVAKGQKIAEMGDSDASRVMLHFEIRRLGKPVDPIKFLPPA